MIRKIGDDIDAMVDENGELTLCVLLASRQPIATIILSLPVLDNLDRLRSDAAREYNVKD